MRTVLRHQISRKPFVTVANVVARDDRLSYAARGLLVAMLSRPTNWAFSADRLAAGSPSEGRKFVQNCLRELEAVGYVFRYRERDMAGRMRTVTVVSDEPIADWQAVLDSRDTLATVHGADTDESVRNDESAGHTEGPAGDSGQTGNPQVTPEVPYGTTVNRPPVSDPPYKRQTTKPRNETQIPDHSSVQPQTEAPFDEQQSSDAAASGPVPPGQSASTRVDGAHVDAQTATSRDLDLATDGPKPMRQKTPWADLHDRWLDGEIDEDDVIEQIGEWVEGYEVGEEQMAIAMLGDGYHVKAILNKIRKDRR